MPAPGVTAVKGPVRQRYGSKVPSPRPHPLPGRGRGWRVRIRQWPARPARPRLTLPTGWDVGAGIGLLDGGALAGQDAVELAAGADPELGEDVAQVVLDRAGGQE